MIVVGPTHHNVPAWIEILKPAKLTQLFGSEHRMPLNPSVHEFLPKKDTKSKNWGLAPPCSDPIWTSSLRRVDPGQALHAPRDDRRAAREHDAGAAACPGGG